MWQSNPVMVIKDWLTCEANILCLERQECSSAESIFQNAFWNLECLCMRDRRSSNLTTRSKNHCQSCHIMWPFLCYVLLIVICSTSYRTFFFEISDSDMETKCHKHKIATNFCVCESQSQKEMWDCSNMVLCILSYYF